MKNNSGDFSMQDVQRMLSNPAAQQLIALLQRSDTTALQKAAEQAKNGDISQAKETLSPLFANEEVKKLLMRLEE